MLSRLKFIFNNHSFNWLTHDILIDTHHRSVPGSANHALRDRPSQDDFNWPELRDCLPCLEGKGVKRIDEYSHLNYYRITQSSAGIAIQMNHGRVKKTEQIIMISNLPNLPLRANSSRSRDIESLNCKSMPGCWPDEALQRRCIALIRHEIK